jgi:hypothetical protein
MGHPLRNDMTAEQMATTEVLTSYGERFWDAMADRVNALASADATLNPKRIACVWLFDAYGDPSDPSVLLLLRTASAANGGRELYSVPVSVQGSTIEAPSHHAQRTLREATGVNVPLSGLAEVRVRSDERDNPRGELHDFVATATRGEIAAVVNAQPSRHSRLVWVPMSRLEELADHDVFCGLKERSREALWKARTSGQISWLW